MSSKTEARVWIHASLVDPAAGKPRPNRSLSSRVSSSSRHGGPPSRSSSFVTVSTTASTDSSEAEHANPASLLQQSSSDTLKASATAPSCQYEWREGWMTKDESGGVVTVRVPDPSGRAEAEANVAVPIGKLEKGDALVLANEPGTAPDDLVVLRHFNEPSVVECLRIRYGAGDVYTATGPVLLALNPFRHVSNLYGDDVMERYWEKVETADPAPLRPHVYGIADRSFRSMMRGIELSFGASRSSNGGGGGRICPSHVPKHDQCILVSGESGSGKTVSTKYVMKYLAALSQRAAQHGAGGTGTSRAYRKAKTKCGRTTIQRHASSDLDHANVLRDYSNRPASTSSVEERNVASPPTESHAVAVEAKVLQSNPILESFGNARTVRNDNSSRFGKFIEMQFARNGRLLGTKIETYLLEKVRVVSQSEGERNYHIFYELLSGALPTEELQMLHLQGSAHPKDFRITSNGTTDRRDGVCDKDTFRQVQKALRLIGISDDERNDIFSVTAALLHASNLTFLEGANDGSMLQSTNRHLKPLCDLLGTNLELLEEALCFANITVRGNVYKKTQSICNARKGLDAFLMACYGAVFSHLVGRVNDTIAVKESVEIGSENSCPVAMIGVLDIFGFESFTTNSFEQLCINYCNEVLQQQFNTFMLKNEQAEYVSEGIEWEFIKFPENQDVLDLLTDRSNGMLSVLDDMCRAPGASDSAFYLEVLKRCEGNSRFEPGHHQRCIPTFAVHHYAGAVEYTVDGFIEKNRDDLPRETVDLLLKSSKSLVRTLAGIIMNSTDQTDCLDEPEGGAHKGVRHTVGSHFREQVRDLRSKIDGTSHHYVRCIKPNPNLTPEAFDNCLVAHQLRCGGVLQAVSVTRSGFTLHYTHADFVKRYGILNKEIRKATSKNSQRGCVTRCEALVDVLLKSVESPPDSTVTAAQTANDTERSIRFGTSKVLLKHGAFEALERMIGVMQIQGANVINAWLRRFLCKVAFTSVRRSFRDELERMGTTFEVWFQENREIYYCKRDKSRRSIPNIVRQRRNMFLRKAEREAETQVAPRRASNVLNAAVTPKNPAWIISDGLWTRNPGYLASTGNA